MNNIEWKSLQTFGQVERNNNRSSQIESTRGGQLTDRTKTPRQSINVLHTLQRRHFSSVYLMNIRFYLIDLKCSTDYIKAFGIPNNNNMVITKWGKKTFQHLCA